MRRRLSCGALVGNVSSARVRPSTVLWTRRKASGRDSWPLRSHISQSFAGGSSTRLPRSRGIQGFGYNQIRASRAWPTPGRGSEAETPLPVDGAWGWPLVAF
jgi:hypothetical protein